ncbi:PKD domain-containing protein [Candidatus Bipolaricaulota bacterium]|nr:PKD domain-containing protein [Candidatus Bipolaricaulota bacterium]
MRKNTYLAIRNMLFVVSLVICLGLSGCLFPATNRAPVAVLDVLPREGYTPLVVSFDASKSFDPEGTAVTIQWDFGDGQTATGSLITHSYRKAGTYKVRVTLVDTEGKVASVIVPIVVRAIPDGFTLRTFRWEREGEPRTWDMLIPYDLYQDYKGRLRNSPYIDKYVDFVRDPLDDPTLHDYAMELWNRAGQNQSEFVEETLAFVQGAIKYQADPPGIEHPLYPLETLADGDGDCEDTAILFVSLLKAMDVACKLAFVDTDGDGTPDHVLALVAVSSRQLSELTCAAEIVPFTWSDGTFVIAESAVDVGVYGLGCDPWGLDESDLAELWSFPEP